ncbi:MAG: hypothetical protein HKN25_15750 [Pyrinomonadaceae bacterium]|nr:hypothetical protein [Pyrinomonadaceae bacterium]
MFTKIYLALLAIAVALMSFLTYFSYSWLNSIGDPENTLQNYLFYSGISWTALWISFVALLLLANIVLWKDRKGWALWLSLVFFAGFIVVQMFFVDQAFFNFQKENDLTEKSYFLTPVLGVAICVVAAIGIFFNQYLVTRMSEKMLGSEQQEDEVSGEE